MTEEATSSQAAEAEAAAEAPKPEKKKVPLPMDPALRSAVLVTAVTALIFSVIGAVVVAPFWGLGVLVGGMLATANLVLFIRLGRMYLELQGQSTPWALMAVLKLIGLFACVGVILWRGAVPPLAFVIGYGALPIGISIGSLIKPAGKSQR